MPEKALHGEHYFCSLLDILAIATPHAQSQALLQPGKAQSVRPWAETVRVSLILNAKHGFVGLHKWEQHVAFFELKHCSFKAQSKYGSRAAT